MWVNSLKLFLGLSRLPVGLTELDLHLIEVSLHLLLQTQGLIPAASLSFKRALKSIHNPLLVSLCLLHLFIFLSQLAFDISLNLVELKLDSENLPFLMLQWGLLRYKIKYITSYYKLPKNNVELSIKAFNIPLLLPRLFVSQTSLVPAAFESSQAHEYSFHPHQFAQWGQIFPLRGKI